MKPFNIGSIQISEDSPPVVIAEIGINHGGSLSEAIKIAGSAIDAGAHIVKHQTHIVEDEMSGAARNVIPGNSDKSIYEIISECALDLPEEKSLMDYVVSRGAEFISTPFSRAAVHRLIELNVPAYKIGSGECNNYPLVDLIARQGKPVILSTGMNSIGSVRKSVAILEKNQVPYVLLHTTNLYPTPHHLVRLGGMLELKDNFPNAFVGLSDHTVDNYACFAATALGATVLERHFTDSMNRIGPDIANSMDPTACAELINGTRIIKQELGGSKNYIPEEQVTMDFAFATVVTTKSISKGELFTRDNIWVKRPGTGEYTAEQYETLLGRRATRDIESDSHLMSGDVHN
jgi:N-acetylneuraminate synthase